MTHKHDSTSDQNLHLDAPVTLTPDQIAEVAGGVAINAAALLKLGPPIIAGGIMGPGTLPEQISYTAAI